MEIFQPNNHSVWQIAYRPVSDQKKDTVSSLVLNRYRSVAKRVVSVDQVNEVEISSNNFRVGIENDSEQKKILTRAYPPGSDDVLIQEVISAAKFLRSEGVSVPTVINSDHGESLTAFEGLNHIVFDFIEGNHFRGTFSELASAARGIGSLFKTLGKLPADLKLDELKSNPSKAEDFKFSREIWLDLFQTIQVRHSVAPHETSSLLLKYKDLILTSVDEVESLPTSPTQIIHNDLHPHNFIADGTSILAFLDMDALCPWERMKAVAFATHRLIRQCIVHQRPSDLKTTVENGKSIFLKEYLNVNTLDPKEILGLRHFIVHEALRRMTYVVKGVYLKNDPRWQNDVKKNISSLLESSYF